MSPSPEPRVEVHRITAAQRSHSEDLNARMGKYLLSMGVRTVCFVLVLVVDGPLRWVFAVGAIGLPYVAVVLANAGSGRREPAPAVVTLPPARRAVGAPPVDLTPADRAPSGAARPPV